MGKNRIWVVLFVVAAAALVGVGIYRRIRWRRDAAAATAAAASASARAKADVDFDFTNDAPFAPRCTATCDLATKDGLIAAFRATAALPVSEDSACTMLPSGDFPRVAAFGRKSAPDAPCDRVGAFYGCCFTANGRAATHDALALQGWRDADFKTRAAMAGNWIVTGIWGLTEWRDVSGQRTFEAKAVLGHELDRPSAKPLPDGGVVTRVWLVRETPTRFDYMRVEYAFAGDGSLAAEHRVGSDGADK
jgi:hypothetical protein